MSQNTAAGIHWDLSDLYTSTEDQAIAQDLDSAAKSAAQFTKKYEKLFADPSLDAKHLEEALRDYETITTLLTRAYVYAMLQFAVHTDQAVYGAFYQKIQTQVSQIKTKLIFFEVGWTSLETSAALKLMSDPCLSHRKHFLAKLRSYSPHTLSEAEEKVLTLKANTGANAFKRFFDELINNIVFEIELDGKIVQKTESDILSLFHSQDRALRKKASESLSKGLQDNTRAINFTFNTLLADHRLEMNLRHFKHPMDMMNLSNEITLESVTNLIESVKEAYPMAQRYYRLKKELLGLPELYDYDRYAGLESDSQRIDFKQCREIVLEGYYGFDKTAGDIAQQFFDKKWIDAEVRPGKRGGGFCCETLPDLHPYILVNYTGTLRDVMTVAHEIGHGIHQYLSRKAGILESSAPLTMAETASVFGEMIVFNQLFKKESDPKRKLALVCGKIDDNFATVFRQISMTDFEIRAHQAGLEDGELSQERLSDIWMACNKEFYGDSVTLSPAYRHGWKYIPHFVHSPFYCYAYAFAQLFVLCLYDRYQKGSPDFVQNYYSMLEKGGSLEPQEIARIAGFDLSDKTLWTNGLGILNKLVDQAHQLRG